jgi:hypothetical protein
MTPVLRNTGREELAGFVERLSSTVSGIEFYDAVQQEWDQGGDVSAHLGEAARAQVVPGSDPAAIVARIQRSSLAELIQNRQIYVSQLEGARRFAALTGDSIPVSISTACEKAGELQRRIQAVFRRREMTLLFIRRHDHNWHVDVRPAGGPGIWKAAKWADSDDTGCRVRVRVAPGESISVRLNQEMRDHATTMEGSPCVSGGATTLTLAASKGTLTVSGWQIEWAVIENWPEWQPSTE